MVNLARLGTILLGIWLILFGLAAFGLVVPAPMMAILAIIAGICILLGQFRVQVA